MRLHLFRSREERVMIMITPGRYDDGWGGNPKNVPSVVVVHPRLAKLANPANLALRAVGSYFFLKNPNFGFGFAGAPPPAPAVAVIHSCIFATSHVI